MKKIAFFMFSFCLLFIMSCQPVTNGNNENKENKEQENKVAMSPNIITQPKSDKYISNNQTLKLSVVAKVSDGGTLTYQWYKNDEAVKGATDSSYSEKVNVTEDEEAKYYCEITNTLKNSEPPFFTRSVVKTESIEINFIASIESGTNSYTLQVGKTQDIDVNNISVALLVWKSSDEKVATVKDGKITAIAEGTASITASIGEISRIWKVTVNNKENASTPIYSFMYGSQNITENKKLSFIKEGKLKVTASVADKNSILTYKWNINGEFADETMEITVSKPGVYYCEITNTITEDNIEGATASIKTPKLTVEVEKPVISGFIYGDEPVADNKAFAKAGASLKIQVSVSESAGDLTYKWFKENSLISSANGGALPITEYGNYYCVVTNQIAGEEYNVDITSDKVEIAENKISFQDVIDRAENKSASGLTISDTVISYGEEEIDLGKEFGDMVFTGGNAVVNKSLTISSTKDIKLLEKSDLKINADGVKLAGLTLGKVEATESLGNGSLTIADSKLNDLLLNGGGYNSIHLEGTNNVTNVSFGKKDTTEYTRLSVENGSTTIANLSATSSGMIQGDVTVGTVTADNWSEVNINLAMQISAKIPVPEDTVEIFFGQNNSTNNNSTNNYEPKFKVLLKKEVTLNKNFLNQAGQKLWGDDFYGYTWLNIHNNESIDTATLTSKTIGQLFSNAPKIKLACDAKEKAILLPHIEPTEKYISRNNGKTFNLAVKQFHLTHYSKLYDSLNDHENKLDINDPKKVELKTTLLDLGSDDNKYIDLKGYENAFSVVHDDNRNVYSTIACGNVTSDSDLRRYGHFYIKMLKEEDITKNLKDGEVAEVTMEKKFNLPIYLTDLSYLGDQTSDYAAVDSVVEYFKTVKSYSFNNNFVASFARLAVNAEGTKLYLLTGAYGKDVEGNTYKLCVYDLTDTGDMFIPDEVTVAWQTGVPQAMALSEDGKKLYVAEMKYGLGGEVYRPDNCSSYINVYDISGNSATYSSSLISYSKLPYTFDIGYYDASKTFGKMRVGVSDMKIGNGHLYITTENVNLHAFVTSGAGKYSHGGLTIVNLTSGEIESGKEAIGYTSAACPDDSDEYKYFYGPARILAVEPKKIIILDDGNITDETDSWPFSLLGTATDAWSENFLKQKNRVAVYDLESETLNFANMGSEFGLYSTRYVGSF